MRSKWVITAAAAVAGVALLTSHTVAAPGATVRVSVGSTGNQGDQPVDTGTPLSVRTVFAPPSTLGPPTSFLEILTATKISSFTTPRAAKPLEQASMAPAIKPLMAQAGPRLSTKTAGISRFRRAHRIWFPGTATDPSMSSSMTSRAARPSELA